MKYKQTITTTNPPWFLVCFTGTRPSFLFSPQCFCFLSCSYWPVQEYWRMFRADFKGYSWVDAEKSPTEIMGLELWGLQKGFMALKQAQNKLVFMVYNPTLPLYAIPKGVFCPLKCCCCYSYIVRIDPGMIWPKPASFQTGPTHLQKLTSYPIQSLSLHHTFITSISFLLRISFWNSGKDLIKEKYCQVVSWQGTTVLFHCDFLRIIESQNRLGWKRL